MLSLDSRIAVTGDVFDQDVQGERVLLHLGTESYFSLNPLGALVWQRLGEGMTPRGIHGLMHDAYQVDPEQLELDLIALLEDLLRAGLVVVLPPEGDPRE